MTKKFKSVGSGAIIIVGIFFLVQTSFFKKLFSSRDEFAEGLSDTKYAYAENVFKSICSGCHGENMEAFADRKWKHGNAKDSLIRSIKFGYADLGMPSFNSTFTETQINDIADYINYGIANVKQYDFKNKTITSNFFTAESQNILLDTILTGIDHPWSIAFLPDDEMLITERSGKLFRLTKTKVLENIGGGPEVLAEGQGGLMDIALHPDFKKNKFIYFSYSLPKKIDSLTLATTAVMRAKLVGNRLVEQKNIFIALPYSKTRHHFGSRLQFGNDGMLYISVGERGNERENPQSLNNFLGKIHRIREDGSIPSDNPFINQAGSIPSIFSYGHRNPQGLTINPATGAIWSNEHGPRGGDEINIISKGKNYGWPIITYGINYDGKPISNLSKKDGLEQPELYWVPSIAPSGMTFVTGDRYKNWQGDILVGSLRFKYLDRCKVKDGKIIAQEMLLKNIGRVRDVRMGPDGYVYISVESPGAVFRLMPANNK